VTALQKFVQCWTYESMGENWTSAKSETHLFCLVHQVGTTSTDKPLYLLKISINTHTHIRALDPPSPFPFPLQPTPRVPHSNVWIPSITWTPLLPGWTDATGGPCTLPRSSSYQGNGACQWPITIEKACCWVSHLSLQFISFRRTWCPVRSLPRHKNTNNQINASHTMWQVW
jgi:hypothetical protein